MRPLRSLLFVPGHKPSWVEKAWRAGPDGLILDMEDAVPASQKGAARKEVRKILDRADPQDYICVRINSLATGMIHDDLEAVAHANLSAVMLPKVYKADELAEVDQALSRLEKKQGLQPGGIATPLLLETALAMRHAYDIAVASPRVDAILMSAGPGGDAARAIGYQWSKQGAETLYLRSKLVLDSRAAAVPPLINSWYDVADLEGLAADARLNRSLGYVGMALIHPSHVPVVNEIFTPTASELAFYEGLLQAFKEAEKQGHAAVVYDGDMVDYAMAQTAREILEFARRLNEGK